MKIWNNTYVNASLKFIEMTEIRRVMFLIKMWNFYFCYNSLNLNKIKNITVPSRKAWGKGVLI